MDKSLRDSIKELKVQIEAIENNSEKKKIKRQIGSIIKQGIEELKKRVDKDNPYKKYIEENKDMISKKYGFNVVVNDHDEAVELLKALDIRELFNIDIKLNIPFESKIFVDIEEVEGGLYNTIEEAKREIEEDEVNGKKIIDFKLEQTKFKKWTYSATYSIGNKKVYINTINKKYKLFFKRNNGVDRGVQEESFDIINLYEIIMDIKDTYNTIVQLCLLLNIQVKYTIEQNEKYDFNIDIINNKKYLQDNYKKLYKYIGEYLYILEEILEEGKRNIESSRNSFSGENIFFYYGEKLHNNLKEKNKVNLLIDPKTQGELSTLINAFCVLGLIRKLKNNEVPQKMKRELKNGKKFCNYFIVKKYNEQVFNYAEKMVIKLNENRITATKVTGGLCENVIKKELYDQVFKNNEKTTRKAQKTIANKK